VGEFIEPGVADGDGPGPPSTVPLSSKSQRGPPALAHEAHRQRSRAPLDG
jgi:hypothetical protein